MSAVTEWKWIALFAAQLERCALDITETAVVLSESSSRAELVLTARLAAQSLDASVIDVVLPTPANAGPVAIRSTGASVAIAGHPSAIAACRAADLVIDCTVEGLLHAPELGRILEAGTRVLMISNEHPENFERMVHDPTLEERVAAGVGRLRSAVTMRVTSPAGTDLTVRLPGAVCAGSKGWTTDPGDIAHWPGGLVLAFPAAGSVDGTVVLAPGDLNLTFKEYVREPVLLRIERDYIVAIEGDGFDAQLFRSYLEAWDDREAFAVSHVGWGMNRFARWDYLPLYDKGQVNGTEARAFAGNFLYSTGANETAGRFTRGHFDLPMRNCTVVLDGTYAVVRDGILHPDLA